MLLTSHLDHILDVYITKMHRINFQRKIFQLTQSTPFIQKAIIDVYLPKCAIPHNSSIHPARKHNKIAAFTVPTLAPLVYESVNKDIKAVGAMLSSGMVPKNRYIIPPQRDE